MTKPGETRPITAGDEFRICPACRYQLGFHVSFVAPQLTGGKAPATPVKKAHNLHLICPGCWARFNAGWKGPLNG